MTPARLAAGLALASLASTLWLASATSPAPGGLATGSTASRSRLVALTTGTGDLLTSDLVTVDPREGTCQKVGPLVLSKGHGRVQSQDLVWSQDGKRLLVAQLEFGEKPNEATCWLDTIDPSSLAVERSGVRSPGILDALCWDGQGRLLAVKGASRPLQFVALDPKTGQATDLGALETRLWIRSLVWRAKEGELWGLHMRVSETDGDLLVRLSPQNGAVLQTVKLDLGEIATTLGLDADGTCLVGGAKEGLFRVDLASGKGQRLPKATGHLLTGLMPGR